MEAPRDLTGRERLTWNILTSWACHFIYIVTGFVLPRLIDHRLGQDRLGVWDFAWSFIAYFGLVQGGVVSSINRYVAKHRAEQDPDGLNRAVSSVSCVLAVMAAIVAALSIGGALLVPIFWGGGLGDFADDAQWVVLLLGLGLACEVGLSSYAGVLTGCHRWDLHNAVHALTYVLTSTGMIAAVLLGGGLVWLAAAHVSGELVGRLLRVVLAYRECRGLRVRVGLARWSTAREMLHFGSKGFIPQIGDLLLNQTISVLVLGSLGAGALALFSRPRSLVRQVDALVSKLAFVLAPTASSLQATQREDQLREMFVQFTRYAAYLALPALLTLAILGGPLLRIWMGPKYALGPLAAILALGSLTAIVQQPVLSLLSGLNAHGRPGLANFGASIVAAACAYVALGPLGWGLVGAALAVTLPMTLASGLCVPWLACGTLKLPFGQYFQLVWWPPLLHTAPFALCLLAVRWLFAGQPLLAVAVGLAAGAPMLALIYYKFVVPARVKAALFSRLGRPWFQRARSTA